MPSTELRRKLAWLIGVRAAIGTVLLGTGILIHVDAPGAIPLSPFFLLISLIYALTLVYTLALPLVDRHQWIVDVQLAGDALITSGFIAVTGGINSLFSLLYVLPIIAASMVQRRSSAMMVATLCSLMYGVIVLIQYGRIDVAAAAFWLRGPAVALPSGYAAQYTVATNVFAFLAVAVLSGSLAESLRRTGASLERASAELANVQAINQHVIDSLTSGLLTTDYSGRVLTVNLGAETIIGHPASSLVGRNVNEVLQLPRDLATALETKLDGARSRRADYQFRTGDNRQIDIGLSATHLVTSSGRAGYLFTFQDVTEMRRLEREARVKQRLAAVGEMAAGIAHEIRNPLASMSGSIQVLRQELQLSDEQAQLMDIVVRESDRLNDTIRSFLAYARPQRSGLARFDVGALLNDVALLLRNSTEVADNHIVVVEVPGEEVWYEADEGQIRQIVWNLATNGLRAMPDGGRLTLSTSFEKQPGRDSGVAEDGADVVLRVRDEGVGIPEEELDGMFQPFHGSFARGSGLGLAIVHRIVSDYNGEIRVTSRPGSGTTVEVRLPATQAAGSGQWAAGSWQQAADGRQQAAGKQ
jgi:two-component system sensor histidine kinase PilS (NtrC family)